MKEEEIKKLMEEEPAITIMSNGEIIVSLHSPFNREFIKRVFPKESKELLDRWKDFHGKIYCG